MGLLFWIAMNFIAFNVLLSVDFEAYRSGLFNCFIDAAVLLI